MRDWGLAAETRVGGPAQRQASKDGTEIGVVTINLELELEFELELELRLELGSEL